MKHRLLASSSVLGVFIATALVMTLPVFGQSPAQPSSVGAKAGARAKKYVAPRTADGQPDLQGVWANNNATPFERPAALAGKPLLTDAEVVALKARAAELFSGDGDAAFGDDVFVAAVSGAKTFTSSDVTTGNYNQFWIADRDFDNRTSMVTDPPDGRVPPLTPEAQQKRARLQQLRAQPGYGFNNPEERSLGERCITFGAPRLGAAYNSYFQIFQARDHVAIAMETIHDERVDEVIVSTFPGERSGWLRRDLVGRLRSDTGLPVQHVVADPALLDSHQKALTGERT